MPTRSASTSGAIRRAAAPPRRGARSAAGRDAELAGEHERRARQQRRGVVENRVAWTMLGELLPSSSSVRRRPTERRISSPTATLPVNGYPPKRWSSRSWRPTVSPGPNTSDRWFRGSPASVAPLGQQRRRERRQLGRLQHDRAARRDRPALWLIWLSGALNGVIAHTGPTGTRSVKPRRCSAPGVASIGTVSPASRLLSSAHRRIAWTARRTSIRASRIGLPASAVIVWATARPAPPPAPRCARGFVAVKRRDRFVHRRRGRDRRVHLLRHRHFASSPPSYGEITGSVSAGITPRRMSRSAWCASDAVTNLCS